MNEPIQSALNSISRIVQELTEENQELRKRLRAISEDYKDAKVENAALRTLPGAREHVCLSREFSCPHCGKPYKTQYGVRNHERLHCNSPDSMNQRHPASLPVHSHE